MNKSAPYAQPLHVENLDECSFYHVMDLPGFGTVGDGWDLRGRLEDYTGNVELAGKRVLDVGTASGFLTFEMEKRGARVVSFDMDSPGRCFWIPMTRDIFFTDRALWITGYSRFLRKMKNGYWLAHRLCGSKAECIYGDVYSTPDSIGEFDIVMVGQILVHLSDPIRAIASLMDRSRDLMVITEGMIDSDVPAAYLCARAETRQNWSWWHLSIGLYREVFRMAGWTIESVQKSKYRCTALGEDVELTTLVVRRGSESPRCNVSYQPVEY
jgi:SAM-dependent methyltransferase